MVISKIWDNIWVYRTTADLLIVTMTSLSLFTDREWALCTATCLRDRHLSPSGTAQNKQNIKPRTVLLVPDQIYDIVERMYTAEKSNDTSLKLMQTLLIKQCSQVERMCQVRVSLEEHWTG